MAIGSSNFAEALRSEPTAKGNLDSVFVHDGCLTVEHNLLCNYIKNLRAYRCKMLVSVHRKHRTNGFVVCIYIHWTFKF